MDKFKTDKFLVAILVLLLILVFDVFGFCGCSASKLENRPLIVGFDANFPPMGFVEEGKACGADVDFMQLVAKQMGREIIFQPIDWDAKELELNSGKIDLIANGL